LYGQVLISTGVAGLDRLLGGGLPLGSILLLLEDSNSQQHLNLIKCFMAEGVCCKHSVAWVMAQQLTPESIAAFLPDQARSGSGSTSSNQVRHTFCEADMHMCRMLHLKPVHIWREFARFCRCVALLHVHVTAMRRFALQPAQPASSNTGGSAGTAAAGSSAAAPDDGLKIAWQYRKYIQSQQRAEPVAPDRSRTSSNR
jgi:hypothetical protein